MHNIMTDGIRMICSYSESFLLLCCHLKYLVVSSISLTVDLHEMVYIETISTQILDCLYTACTEMCNMKCIMTMRRLIVGDFYLSLGT